jgi:hypothetical protein
MRNPMSRAKSAGKRGVKGAEISQVSKANILSLPRELYLMIFKYFDRVTLICMGLTCKTLYNFIATTYRIGVVPLSDMTHCDGKPIWLYMLLDEWMGPDKIYGGCHAKGFVKPDQLNLSKDQKDFLIWKKQVGFRHWL